jgi:hypothetical protein
MRAEGLYTIYSLRDASKDGFHDELVNAVQKEMQTSKIAKKDLLRLQKSQRIGPGCSS